MNKEELLEFCSEWLDSWTGNNPDKLIAYYSDDAIYVDPEKRDGLNGREEILRYFKKLLGYYHSWSWRPLEIFPTENGFIVKWECSIPIGSTTINEVGMDIVELDGRKITRNEVYFDRTRLLAAVSEQRRQERLIR